MGKKGCMQKKNEKRPFKQSASQPQQPQQTQQPTVSQAANKPIK